LYRIEQGFEVKDPVGGVGVIVPPAPGTFYVLFVKDFFNI
jgi:hypothetical protein